MGADGRLRKQEKGNGRGFLLPRGITPFRISAAVLLHPIWVRAGAAYPCRANRLQVPTGYNRRTWIISTGKNVARHCYPPGDPLLPFGQFTLCRALLEVNRLCSSTVSDTANMRIPRGRKNPLPYSSSCLRSLPSAPKVGFQGKRVFKEGRNRRCLPFLPTAVGTA